MINVLYHPDHQHKEALECHMMQSAIPQATFAAQASLDLLSMM
jgi:hypothetical protein